jgi:hypothetical protein
MMMIIVFLEMVRHVVGDRQESGQMVVRRGTEEKGLSLLLFHPPPQHLEHRNRRRRVEQFSVLENNTNIDTDTEEEGLGTLELRFSLWHSAFAASEQVGWNDNLVQIVLSSVQEILCEDTSLSILPTSTSSSQGESNRNNERQDMCHNSFTRRRRLRQRHRQLQEQGTMNEETTPPHSELVFQGDQMSVLSESTSVTMTNHRALVKVNDNDDDNEKELFWTTWRTTYTILQVGEEYLSQAFLQFNEQTTTKELAEDAGEVMANVAQLALDVRIMEGVMNTKLAPVGAVMSVVNQEVETFGPWAFGKKEDVENTTTTTTTTDTPQPSNFDNGSNDNNSDNNNNLVVKAQLAMESNILQFIGAIFFLAHSITVSLLTCLARRRRMARQKRDARLLTKKGKSHHNKGTTERVMTEMGVDRMLDIGRQQSMELLFQHYQVKDIGFQPSPPPPPQKQQRKQQKQQEASSSSTLTIPVGSSSDGWDVDDISFAKKKKEKARSPRSQQEMEPSGPSSKVSSAMKTKKNPTRKEKQQQQQRTDPPPPRPKVQDVETATGNLGEKETRMIPTTMEPPSTQRRRPPPLPPPSESRHDQSRTSNHKNPNHSRRKTNRGHHHGPPATKKSSSSSSSSFSSSTYYAVPNKGNPRAVVSNPSNESSENKMLSHTSTSMIPNFTKPSQVDVELYL